MSQKRTLKKIVKSLCKIKGLRAIILYGSFARGDYGASSDIDILIITDDDKSSSNAQDELIRLETKRNIQPTIRTMNELKKTDTGLLQNIFTEGKILYLRLPMDIDAALLLNQKPYFIYTFDLTNLNQRAKARFNRELYQRKSKKYSYAGVLQKNGGVKLSSGCILIPNSKKGAIDKFLNKYKIKTKVIRVWR